MSISNEINELRNKINIIEHENNKSREQLKSVVNDIEALLIVASEDKDLYDIIATEFPFLLEKDLTDKIINCSDVNELKIYSSQLEVSIKSLMEQVRMMLNDC